MSGYREYNNEFFTRLAPWYNLVALPVIPVRRTMVRLAGVSPGDTVLDMCTGTGAVGAAFASAECRVIGVDLCAAMLDKGRRVREGLPFTVVLGDGEQLPLPDASVDVATISLGLHDMPHRVRRTALAEMRRVARRCLVVMDYEFPRVRWIDGVYATIVRSYETHYFPQFHKTGLRAHLEEAGLHIEAHARSWDGFFGMYRCS